MSAPYLITPNYSRSPPHVRQPLLACSRGHCGRQLPSLLGLPAPLPPRWSPLPRRSHEGWQVQVSSLRWDPRAWSACVCGRAPAQAAAGQDGVGQQQGWLGMSPVPHGTWQPPVTCVWPAGTGAPAVLEVLLGPDTPLLASSLGRGPLSPWHVASPTLGLSGGERRHCRVLVRRQRQVCPQPCPLPFSLAWPWRSPSPAHRLTCPCPPTAQVPEPRRRQVAVSPRQRECGAWAAGVQ